MKNTLLLSVLCLALILAACAPAIPVMEEAAPTATASPEPSPTVEPTPTTVPTAESPAGKVPALPVKAVTYSDETIGLLMDIPADWTIGEKQVIGDRASQTLLTAPGGASQISVTLYQWDPKNDLAAYVDHRKEAWAASDLKVLSDDEWVLDNGQSVMVYTLLSPK